MVEKDDHTHTGDSGGTSRISTMKRKKIDNRIRVLIENGVALKHRGMFVVVGQKARDQVVFLHHMLSKSIVKARPSVLWCYKKNLGFTTHRQKRMKEIQRRVRSGTLDVNEQDPFELFVASTQIRYTYYNETHKILGQTFGMLVLQDFEAITPNILARTVETVEGGGLICILLHSINSLKQLYTMTMDVHSRYRTEVHTRVVNRFNERFLLSLADHTTCLVVDDKLNILPLSSRAAEVSPVIPANDNEENSELTELKASLANSPVSSIAVQCATTSQIQALILMLDVLAQKSSRATVALTAARGRGKSAALGLAIAAGLATGYCSIFVTAPSPENLKTLFEFIIKGLDAMKYEQHSDYDVVQSTNPEFKKSIVRIVMHVHEQPRQIVQYIHPQDYKYAANAELLIIDEAAAIPLPLVKNLMGPFMVFLSSTINGYEGTGRSLSLKLIAQLRKDSASAGGQANSETLGGARFLKEFHLEESIRYKPGDQCEAWLNQLLCLDATTDRYFGASVGSGCPPPQDCQLFYVNRDTLFSYHKVSEAFLQELVGLYVASHYKNSPNDLQLLSDAPAHHLFVLLAPVGKNSKSELPQVLCVIQLCYEGGISESSATSHLSRDQQPSGDLIPWTVAQQFQDANFARLSGARIVRIATHPDYQSMGYGKQAMQQLIQFFQGYHLSLSEEKGVGSVDPEAQILDELTEASTDLLRERIEPRRSLPPLLLRLDEFKPRQLDYVGVSFGLTNSLFKFWKSLGFSPVYVRQTANELTGEHSSIMVKALDDNSTWLSLLFKDFRKRFAALLGFQLSALDSKLASSVIVNPICREASGSLSVEDLNREFSSYDIKRLEQYCNNLADHHLIMDMVPVLARWFFLGQMDTNGNETFHLSLVQQCILLAVGLQHCTVEAIAANLDIDRVQCLGLFNRTIRKFLTRFQRILETQIVSQEFDTNSHSTVNKGDELRPLRKSLKRELEEGAEAIRRKQKEDIIKELNLTQYAIKGTDDEWKAALGEHGKSLISIKSLNKRPDDDQDEDMCNDIPGLKQKKKMMKFNKKKSLR